MRRDLHDIFLENLELKKQNRRLEKMLTDLTDGTNRVQRLMLVTGLEPDVGLPYANVGNGYLSSEEQR